MFALGVPIEWMARFRDLAELRRVRSVLPAIGAMTACPRSLFFEEIPFRAPRFAFPHPGPTIGLHLGGSAFSVGVQRAGGLAPKTLPAAVLCDVLPESCNILLFGTRAELDRLAIAPGSRLAHVCFDDISRSLAMVSSCDAFIGSDSAFKTMSAMSRIPTLVLMADYADETRDRNFITPYVEAGVMGVHRYHDLGDPDDLGRAAEVLRRFFAWFDTRGVGEVA